MCQRAETIIDKAFNGQRNFMTPHRLSCEIYGDFAVEISRNDTASGGIFGNMFGVTVVQISTGKARHDLAQCFASREDANDHVRENIDKE